MICTTSRTLTIHHLDLHVNCRALPFQAVWTALETRGDLSSNPWATYVDEYGYRSIVNMVNCRAHPFRAVWTVTG